jgi:hypothetical protein
VTTQKPQHLVLKKEISIHMPCGRESEGIRRPDAGCSGAGWFSALLNVPRVILSK